ncbi:MAG: hypothetical protein CVU11_10440 [Bacteroidetes bacterium HGW-Bacteroidetes-6]|nr:MAG: hypothetical protein CVU11_10440 [Bacteroidetes bacterium HGW-Bacteroidetes-6]
MRMKFGAKIMFISELFFGSYTQTVILSCMVPFCLSSLINGRTNSFIQHTKNKMLIFVYIKNHSKWIIH